MFFIISRRNFEASKDYEQYDELKVYIESINFKSLKKKENPEEFLKRNKFKELDFLSLKNENAIIYDVKNFLPNNVVDSRL